MPCQLVHDPIWGEEEGFTPLVCIDTYHDTTTSSISIPTGRRRHEEVDEDYQQSYCQ